MDNNLYMAHHGIKGMKWGVRRFQNRDGSLTSAGKKRYSNDVDQAFKSLANSGKQPKAPKTPLTKEEIANVGLKSKQGGRVISGSQDVVRGLQKANDVATQQPKNRYNKRPNLTQEEMDNMSDKELRDLVNRLNLEQQYSQLTQDNESKSWVNTGLAYAEAALNIAGGALTIATAVKLLRG